MTNIARRSWMKRLSPFVLRGFAALPLAFAPLSCLAYIFQYSLKSADGKLTPFTPGKGIPLSAGGTYTLSVTFIPDHRNCTTPAEATACSLAGVAAAKDGVPENNRTPLALVSPGAWVRGSSRPYTQTLNFTACEKGRFDLEVVRDCQKGGYVDYLSFVVK
jgi:hypothetical protein